MVCKRVEVLVIAPSHSGATMLRIALFAAITGLAAMALTADVPAQPDCKSFYGYWNGNSVTCTNLVGINCVVCPKPQ